MKKKYDTQTKIERYILNQLSNQERVDFEEEMRKDEKLQQDVELTRDIAIGFQQRGEQKALEAIRSTSIEDIRKFISFAEKKRRNKSRIKKSLIAITSVAAVVLIFLFIGTQPKYSPQQLFNDYYTSNTYVLTPSRGMIDDEPQQQLSDLNWAIEQLNQGKANEAIEKLIPISSSQTFEFQEEAQWYLALAYLKDGDREKAKEVLEKMFEEPQTKELLKKIGEGRWF